MVDSKRILLGVAGSVAAYKSADIVRRFLERGCKVTILMSASAQKFITPLTLASLSGERVYTDLFDDDSWRMSHLSLSKSADVFLIVPASANIIAKIANGFADDLISCTVIASTLPLVIAPAMNEQMYKNKVVQENIDKLKKMGVTVISPVVGSLACGVFGEGHLADVDVIVSSVLELFKE